jgi:hypothetical protein
MSVTKSATSPFARLFRSSAAKKSADIDDDPKDIVDEAEDDRKKREENEADPDAPDDDDTEEEAAGKRARRKAKKAKKSKAEGDDDSDETDEADSKARAARARERGRIKAIMSSDAAGKNPAAALFIATSTSASRDDAIAQIALMGSANRASSSARDRLMGVDVPDVGNNDGAGQPSGVRATADAIVMAGKRRRGEA